MTITVIGGCPGTGKTSLAARLANQTNKGVHVETDHFFDFIGNKVDPSTLEAKDQNEVVLKAWCAAAKAYRDGGYTVFVDGVIGPWWLEQLKGEFGEFHYVLLNCDLETCLHRVAERHGQASATPDVVKVMHQQFLKVQPEFTSHRIDTGGKSLERVVADYMKLKETLYQ